MFPLDTAPDPNTWERNVVRTELRNSLGVMTGRAQLMQRQILRSNGLGRPDRDLLLHELTAVLAEVTRMGDRLESMITDTTSRPNGAFEVRAARPGSRPRDLRDALLPPGPAGMDLPIGHALRHTPATAAD
jgi:hypothetical protein